MLIEAFTRAWVQGDTVCEIVHFAYAFAKTYSTPIGYSPFPMPNCRDSLDAATLMKVLNRTK